MPEPDLVEIFVARLNSLDLPWMATGAIAAMIYGEYRVTNDLDVVVILDRGTMDRLPAAFPNEEFYRPPRDVLQVEASRTTRGHFNLIHLETGFKADIYLAADDPLDRWGFTRRQIVETAGGQIWVAPPEYVIIRKLEFYREGGSEKHLRDIRAMLAVTRVERAFIEHETKQRGLLEQWQLCLKAS